MTQTVLGADIGIYIDDGSRSFILDRDTLAGTPVTPVRTFLGSGISGDGDDHVDLILGPVTLPIGTFVAVAVTFSPNLTRIVGATDTHGNVYEWRQAHGTPGVALAWSRIERELDETDFIQVRFDNPSDPDVSIIGAAFTGMSGADFDVLHVAQGTNSVPNSGALVTTGPSDVLIEIFATSDLAGGTLTLTDGGSIAGNVDGGQGKTFLASRIAGAAGSYSAAGTYTGTLDSWTTMALAFTPDTRSILHEAGSELADISAAVLSVDVAWGARTPAGKLTEVEAGKAVIGVMDIDRVYDPANASAPAALNAGTFARIKVDGGNAFTGYLDRAEHSLADEVTTLTFSDALPKLSQMATTVALTGDVTTVQIAEVMAEVGFTGYTILGTSAIYRGPEEVALSAWAALQRIRDSEAGQLYIDRAGNVVYVTRTYSASPTPRADIGDAPGIPLLDIVTVNSRDPIINHVAIDMTDPQPTRSYQDDASVGHYGRRSLGLRQEDLLLNAFVDYDNLAAYILANMANGVGVTGLGALIPEGAQVALLTNADFGDRFHVVDSYHGEPIDRYVETVGAAWNMTYDGGWMVTLVTQDLP